MTKNIFYAAIILGFLSCAFGAINASAQTSNFLPPGSYQKTCKNVFSKSPDLSADCQGKGESTAMKILGTIAATGEDLKSYALEDFFECDGDIWNDDKQLSCKRNRDSALMRRAKNRLALGYRDVYGGDIEQLGYESGYRYYLRELFKAGLAPDFFGAGFPTDKINAYLLKQLNSRPEMKTKVINTVYSEVYGTKADAKNLATYLPFQGGYASIYDAERKKLIADKIVFNITINQAFADAYGRQPTAAERTQWTQRGIPYDPMIREMRNYLYSSKGATELIETIKRDLENKGTKNPADSVVSDKVKQYRARSPRPIFIEM